MTIQDRIDTNMSLVYYIIHKYYPTFINDEDIVQSGMVGLCKAANTWDEEKSTFSTYASICILNEIRIEFRKRKKHQGVLSLDYKYDDTDSIDGVVELGDMIVGAEDVDYVDIQSIYEHLDDFEIKVIKYRNFGMTTVEIAKALGCSQSHISRALRKIIRKWKEYSCG